MQSPTPDWISIAGSIGAALSTFLAALHYGRRKVKKDRDDIIEANVDLRKEYREENIELKKENKRLKEQIFELEDSYWEVVRKLRSLQIEHPDPKAHPPRRLKDKKEE